MTVWIILAITPFIVLVFLEEVIQFGYHRYVYGAGKVEKKLTSMVGTAWKKIQHIVQRSKAKVEG